jgi:hypothetical protein
MVTEEARAAAMAVTFLTAGGGSNGGDGTTTDVHDAILLHYADVVNVRSDNDCNHHPPSMEAINGGVAYFNNCVWCACGG